MNKITKILILILVLIGALIAYTVSDRRDGQPSSPMEQAIPPADDAGDGETADGGGALQAASRAACRNYVLQSLDDPDAAELDADAEWPTRQRPEGTTEILIRGRMKDALGEMINVRWECVVLPEAGVIRLVSLAVLETE